jgi:menaquinone-dependent protoporphyrinogen oxidase
MTKVLVAFASKHGSTEEIAKTIGEVLLAHELDVDVKRMADVDTVFPYDAFVLGSAVYMGSWMRGATRFLDEHDELISTRPTWLFSSGPIGSPPRGAGEESFDHGALVDRTRARDHRQFGGKLDKAQLSLGQRATTGLLRVPYGDYREWDAITAWATAIARALTADVLV